jgi:hypothetical protein
MEVFIALMNPYDAFEAFAQKGLAEILVQNMVEDVALGCGNSVWNGPEDALRHAMWNALMAQDIGPDEAKKFADAHEWDSDSRIETEMDFWNNRVGRKIGAANPDATISELMDLVEEAFLNGELRVLRPIGSGRSEENKLTPTGPYIAISVFGCPVAAASMGDPSDRGRDLYKKVYPDDPGVYGSQLPGSAYESDYPQTPYPDPWLGPRKPSKPPGPPELPRLKTPDDIRGAEIRGRDKANREGRYYGGGEYTHPGPQP